MHVLATAGHVDHGKSTLVRALTGMEPDRWAQERERGMTIDLGYAWTTLPSGEVLGFVDVPGHQRFIANMLAGLGPAPAVMLVVAADEGWRRQTQEHLVAVEALGIDRGLLVVTRSDLADPGPATVDALHRLASSSLGVVEAVTVSGRTGVGLDQLRGALDRLVLAAPAPDTDGPVRLWVDRSFTIKGAGTVVTGTLGAGAVAVGDELELDGRVVRVRGVQSLGRAAQAVTGPARVALNLRGLDRDEIVRGQALLAPGHWQSTPRCDVRLTTVGEPPEHLVVHVGTAAVAARARRLDDGHARLTLARALPLRAGDRLVLREPSSQKVVSGAVVLDADPPDLRRRGAAGRRGADLALVDTRPDLTAEVARRGAVLAEDLRRLGVVGEPSADDVVVQGPWWVSRKRWGEWLAATIEVVERAAVEDPLSPGPTETQVSQVLGLPARELLPALVREVGLTREGGRVRLAVEGGLGRAEPAVAALELRLRADFLAAPEVPELAVLGLGVKEVAAAERLGRLLRVGDVVLLPDAPARAMRVLAGLAQPFTTSDARAALGTTRRVAIPLLEHLDARGWTRRIDGSRREVVTG